MKKKILALALLAGIGFACSTINIGASKLMADETKPKVYVIGLG